MLVGANISYLSTSVNSCNMPLQCFDELSGLLERAVAFVMSLLVAGDINIHLDDLLDTNSVNFEHLIASCALSQHVSGSTHRAGHRIDLLVSCSGVSVASVRVDSPIILSNHAHQIVAKLNPKVETDYPTRRIVRRRWGSFDLDSFIADLDQSALLLSPPSDVHG